MMKNNTYGFYVTTHNNDTVWLDFGNDARKAWKAFYESVRRGEERTLFRNNDVVAFSIEDVYILCTRSNTGKFSHRENSVYDTIWKARHALFEKHGGNYETVSDAILHYFAVVAAL